MSNDRPNSNKSLEQSPCWFKLAREPGLHISALSFLVSVLLGIVAFDFFNSSFAEQSATELAEIRKFRADLASDHRIEAIVNTQSHSALTTLSMAQKSLWIDNNYEQAIGYADRAEHLIATANAIVPMERRDSFDSINIVQKGIWTVRGYAACMKSDHTLLKTSGLRLVALDEYDAEGSLFLGLESMHLASQNISENEIAEARKRFQQCLFVNKKGHESQVFLAVLELDSMNFARAIDLSLSYRVAFPESAIEIQRLGDRPRLFVKLAKGVEVLSSYLKDPKRGHQFPEVVCGDRVSALNKIEGEILIGFLERVRVQVKVVCAKTNQADGQGDELACPANAFVETLIRAIESGSGCNPLSPNVAEPLVVPIRPKSKLPSDEFGRPQGSGSSEPTSEAPSPPPVAVDPSEVRIPIELQ